MGEVQYIRIYKHWQVQDNNKICYPDSKFTFYTLAVISVSSKIWVTVFSGKPCCSLSKHLVRQQSQEIIVMYERLSSNMA